MEHITGHKHAFITDGHVTNVLVFAEEAHDSSLIEDVKVLGDHSDVVCLCWWANQGNTQEPGMYWSWDGTNFLPPTPQWLFANGVINLDPDAPVEPSV
jgi:hypothetical protein